MMPTKANKNTRKNPKVRQAVRSSNKRKRSPWYKKWQFWAVVAVFGLAGSLFLWLTNANSSVNCTALGQSGNTVNFCTAAAPNYNALLATADYVAATNSSTMTSATLNLQVCSPQTLKCKTVDSSNTIKLYNTSQPRYQRLYTHGITFLRGALYRTCFSMTTQIGWTISNKCTQIITYNNNVNNSPQAYSSVAQTQAVASSSTTSNTSCNEGNIAKPGGGTYVCSFDEEFNGTSLDANKWAALPTSSTSFVNTPDCYMNSPNNIYVAGGVLNLTTRKEASPFTCRSPQRGAYTAQVTSGTVSTYQKFSQQYGRFEIRVKIPAVDTTGLEESFWLWPDNPYDQDPANTPWPATGEIDIVEMYHKASDRAIPFIHYNPANTDLNVTNNYCYIDNTQFHTYTLTWTPDTIRIDVDGYNCVLDHPAPKSPQVNPQPFNKKFFLTLTAGLGTSANGNGYVDGVTPLPATTQVDYVRIWK